MGAETPRREADRLTARLAGELRESLCSGDGAAAEATLREARDTGMSPIEIEVRVIEAAMREVGDRWERGELGVDQEHLATALAQQLMASLYWDVLKDSPGDGGTVVLAAVEGERHMLGLRMVADALEGEGHRVAFLGADVPIESIVDAVTRLQPDLVGLSAVTRASAPALVYAVRAMGALGVRVIVGGRGVPDELEEAGVPVIESALALPDDVTRVPPPSAWYPRLEEFDAAVEGEPLPGVERAPDATELLSASTAASAELVRRAIRSSFRHRGLALTDPVTQLPNRHAWDDRMASLPADFRGSIAMIDVDDFKRVNDTLGHDAGDRVLRRLGAMLHEWLRESDFVARVGGDEFAVLLPGASAAAALQVCDRLRMRVEAKAAEDDELAGITLSVGISDWRSGPRATMLAADGALYSAKQAGRDLVHLG